VRGGIMGSTSKKKNHGSSRGRTTEQKSERAGLGYKAGAWGAGILGVVLATALGGWLTDWGRHLVAHSDGGPAIAAVVDVDDSDPGEYVLSGPVVSVADRITLESGTASSSDVMTLIGRHGGVPVGRMDVTLVLEGRRSSLRVVDIRPRLRPKGTAPDAVFLSFPSAGETPTIPVSVDVDHDVPLLMAGSTPYFHRHQIDLTRGERTSLRVTFTATAGYHEFDLVATFITGGKQYQQVIPGPAGGLFRIAARAADYRAYRMVYQGLSGNQFRIADRPQLCRLFPKSRAC
jgi:hypothetical protein